MNAESADLTHELTTSLVGIEAVAKRALYERRAGGDVTKYIERILHQTSQIRKLVSSFHFVSALATGRQPILDLRDLPIDEIARIIEESLSNFSSLNGRRNISHALSLKSSVRGRSVVADRDCFHQAISAVLDNAFRYAYHDSRVTVTLHTRQQKKIEIAVCNKGVQLRTEDVPHIFQRGWRSPIAEATTASGRGIGLWLARTLIDAMHGTLSILPTNHQEITKALIQLPLSA